MTSKTINTRKFQVSPNIIYSLIKAQAGSLAKGILECVMNSVDAGAKRIDIILTNQTLTVADDGKGFRTRDEIEACFEVFGFEHIEGERDYGQFGIGRAQLWNFCSTVWHTNTFRMDVDIKNRGLDYDLVEQTEHVEGLRIEGKFYDLLTTGDILACERDLKELAMFVSIPVTFNGERISEDPSTLKWTHETPHAWIATSSVKRTLAVYNLGVKVCDYPNYKFGCGGLIVTKPGVRLALNMARNDILVAECKVWRKLRPFLQEKTDEEIRRNPRINEEQLANLATRAVAGEVKFSEVEDRKFVVDILGGKHTLQEFFDRAWQTADQTVTFASKQTAGPSADESHKHGYCFVIEQKTLLRFGCASLGELMRRLEGLMEAEGRTSVARRPNRAATPRGKQVPLASLQVTENWREACKRVSEGYTEVPHKDWTKREQAAMATLRGLSRYVRYLLHESGASDSILPERELRLGVSEVAQAWTDGSKLIWLNRVNLGHMDHGMSGVLHILGLLVHEYLHEGPSSGTHVHDEEFHERFHNVLLYFPVRGRARALGNIAVYALTAYLRECKRRDVAIKGRVLMSTEAAEGFGVEVAA